MHAILQLDYGEEYWSTGPQQCRLKDSQPAVHAQANNLVQVPLDLAYRMDEEEQFPVPYQPSALPLKAKVSFRYNDRQREHLRLHCLCSPGPRSMGISM